MDIIHNALRSSQRVPLALILTLASSLVVGGVLLLWLGLFLVVPRPRPPLESEKRYRCVERDGKVNEETKRLPCWLDVLEENVKNIEKNEGGSAARIIEETEIEKAEVFISLVVPAFNEEERLIDMLAEAVEFLEEEYGSNGSTRHVNGHRAKRKNVSQETSNGHATQGKHELRGWEVLVVSDGSTDKTINVALDFAKGLSGDASSNIRVIDLEHNRGKGGAVTHGMRHVRGQYALFADADGASKFSDLGKLVDACKDAEDADGRGVAVGSRAHLVGSEAVVKRSFLRNTLMHSFHLLLQLLTPPATASIRDTQCGFKLFSRASLPYIITHMHSEGWIFDVEMLMLAEASGIKVVEVPVGWHEVKGSKLNVLRDSLGMAWGLAVLRAGWGMGVWRR